VERRNKKLAALHTGNKVTTTVDTVRSSRATECTIVSEKDMSLPLEDINGSRKWLSGLSVIYSAACEFELHFLETATEMFDCGLWTGTQ
jgi:hypothetical protein